MFLCFPASPSCSGCHAASPSVSLIASTARVIGSDAASHGFGLVGHFLASVVVATVAELVFLHRVRCGDKYDGYLVGLSLFINCCLFEVLYCYVCERQR